MGTVIDLHGGPRPERRAGAEWLLDRARVLLEGAAAAERDGNYLGAYNDYAITNGMLYGLAKLELVPAEHPERDTLIELGGTALGGLERNKRRVKALLAGEPLPDLDDEDDEFEDDEDDEESPEDAE